MRVWWCFFFFSSRRRHTRWTGDWSSDVCSSDLAERDADALFGLSPNDPVPDDLRVRQDLPQARLRLAQIPATEHGERPADPAQQLGMPVLRTRGQRSSLGVQLVGFVELVKLAEHASHPEP